MTFGKPQEKTVDINELLRLLALSGGTYASVNKNKQEILAECDKLATVNVIAASLCKANLFSLLGDRQSSEYWLRNAERNGAREEATESRHTCLCLLGYVSEAYPLFDQVVASAPSLLLVRQATSFGLFRKAQSLADKVNQAELSPALKDTIAKGKEYVDSLRLEDSKILQIMDITLSVLRENGLIWLDTLPDIRFFSPEMGGPLICITYRIETTPEQAAGLNEDLVNRLVHMDLDAVGLVVGYTGTLIAAADHAELVH